MPVPVAFSHAGVIDHEEVDVEVVRARSLDLVVFSSDKLHHFDTTAFTFSNWWHVVLVHCVVERIVAPGVIP